MSEHFFSGELSGNTLIRIPSTGIYFGHDFPNTPIPVGLIFDSGTPNAITLEVSEVLGADERRYWSFPRRLVSDGLSEYVATEYNTVTIGPAEAKELSELTTGSRHNGTPLQENYTDFSLMSPSGQFDVYVPTVDVQAVLLGSYDAAPKDDVSVVLGDDIRHVLPRWVREYDQNGQ